MTHLSYPTYPAIGNFQSFRDLPILRLSRGGFEATNGRISSFFYGFVGTQSPFSANDHIAAFVIADFLPKLVNTAFQLLSFHSRFQIDMSGKLRTVKHGLHRLATELEPNRTLDAPVRERQTTTERPKCLKEKHLRSQHPENTEN